MLFRLLGCRRLLVIGQWHQQAARRIRHLWRCLRLRLGRSVNGRLLLLLRFGRLMYARGLLVVGQWLHELVVVRRRNRRLRLRRLRRRRGFKNRLVVTVA